MTENEWTKSICNKIQDSLNKKNLYADVRQRIPYSQEIESYSVEEELDSQEVKKHSKEWKPNYMKPTLFETDLVIYERDKELIKPRVIIEAKLGGITTHDAITYSYKAEKHKYITPFLRYGIMIGDRKEFPLPGRLFRHGTNFDFMFSFIGAVPEDYEWDTFMKMISDEVKYSRITEEMLHENRAKDRNRYYMLQKKLIVKEIEV